MLKRHLAPQTLEKLLLNELAPQREEKTRNPAQAPPPEAKETKMQKSKILAFLLALVVSIVLWFYAVTVVNPTTPSPSAASAFSSRARRP